MLLLGSHVPMKKPGHYLGSIQTALTYGANALMLYSGAPQNTNRLPIKELQIDDALKLIEKQGLSFKNFVGHAPYVVNLANPCENKRAFAVNFLSQELERFAAMQISQMVLHPGNFLKTSQKQALLWITQGLDLILEKTKHLNIKIALETMAGKGTEIGRTLDEINLIRYSVKDLTRISFCLDTCHLFDAGYDLKNNLESFLEEAKTILGIKNISVIHINDSKNNCGSHKDRHENIGFGKIGFETLLKFTHHPLFAHIPKILETPYIEGDPPYQKEIQMLKTKNFNPSLKFF